SKQSNDLPLSRGYTLGSGKDSMTLLELMEFCTQLPYKNGKNDLLQLNAARLKVVLPVFVYAVKHMLMLPVQVSAAEVNLIIYTSCIEQFWATAKVQTVNGVRQLQALVDKKRVIVTESSIRRDLHLDDAKGTDCLTATIFEELARMGAKSTAWNEFSTTMASLIICLATNQKFNLSKYIFDAMVKHLDGGVKFQLKEAAVAHDKTEHEESVSTPSNDPLPNGFTSLKKRVDKLEKRRKFRTTGLKRLNKVGAARRIESSNDSLERQDEDLMFDIGVLDGNEKFMDATTGEKDEQSTKLDDSTAGEAVTTAGVEDSC
ncbi:hypothetical protein Tco_1434393, partial [Tanacetum coccineum]